MILPDLKNEIIQLVVGQMHPLKIILFGSYAYGTPNQDSDLDLAIILPGTTSRHKDAVKVYKLLKDIRIPKDIIVSSLEEYEFYKHEAGSVYKTIDEKGIVLYAR